MYEHVLTRLYNVPLLISGDKLEIITNQVTLKLLVGNKPEKIEISTTNEISSSRSFSKKPKQGLIKIHGSLVAKNATGDSGTVSYESIANQIKSEISNGTEDLIFWIASHGGEAEGCFGLANYIASLPEKFGISTTAIVDGAANSGGYVIAAACKKILATKDSEVGSIAVRATLIDVSTFDEKQGVKYHIVQSKDEKVIYNPHEEMTPKVINHVLEKIKQIDIIMNENVSSHRTQLSIDKIKELNGRTFLAEEALTLGLIDSIIESFDLEIHSISEGNNMSDKTNETLVLENAELKTALAKANENLTLAVQNERKRVIEIMNIGKTIGVSDTLIMKRIEKGSSVEDSKELFEEIKEISQISNPTPEGNNISGINTSIDTGTSKNIFDTIIEGNKILEGMNNV